jgi:hypothetical protein
VDAEDAFFRHPPLALIHQEFPYSLVPYACQVFDLAHAVPRPVSVIEVPQSVTGELRAIATELADAFVANAQSAVHSGFGLVLFGVVAAVARVVLPQERFADAAVHPARGDQIFGEPVWHLTLTGSLGIWELRSLSPESLWRP